MQKSPKKLTRVCLVIEVLVPPAGHPLDFVQLLASIPGRDGPMTRTWQVPGHTVTPDLFADLATWLDTTLIQAVELLGGVQGTIPV